ncbi:hypothetical protein [Bacillus sp. AK031]
MKKKIIFIIILSLCFSGFIFTDKKAGAASEAEVFPEKLEGYLQKAEYYYQTNSLELLDTMQMDGVVDKIVQVDNPETPENEEKTERYNSTLIIGYADYLEKRDTIFFFNVKDVFFYDAENDIFLTYGEVSANEEIRAFFDVYKDGLNKQMLMGSLLKMLILLLVSIVLFPLYIISRKPRQSQVDLFLEGTQKAYFK